MKAVKNLPRDPRDTSLSKSEQQTRKIAENDEAKRGARAFGSASGAEGKAGENGRPAGLRYKFNTNTAESDPGSGKLKLNNAALGAATKLWISETDADENGLATLLATWDDSTNTVRGTITIRSIATGSDIATYNITGAMTDKGTYDAFTIEAKSTGGAFSNEEEITIEFSRAGDKGVDGAEGAAGKEGAEGKEGKEGAAGSASMNGFKEPCRAATTANITISTALNNGDTLDGVSLVTGDRVLVKNQTTKKENGIYIVGVSPARSTDADAAGELRGGTTVYVEQGTVNADRIFSITTNGSITPGTTEHEWAGDPRKIYGAISSTGTKTNGSAGWTVSKPSTGRYNIELSPAATLNPPAVTVTTGPSTSAITVWTLREASTTLIQIQIWNFSGGTALDYPFTFEATLD